MTNKISPRLPGDSPIRARPELAQYGTPGAEISPRLPGESPPRGRTPGVRYGTPGAKISPRLPGDSPPRGRTPGVQYGTPGAKISPRLPDETPPRGQTPVEKFQTPGVSPATPSKEAWSDLDYDLPITTLDIPLSPTSDGGTPVEAYRVNGLNRIDSTLAVAITNPLQNQIMFRQARIDTYASIEKRISYVSVATSTLSVLYITLTILACETAWSETGFDTQAGAVMGMQALLMAISFMITGLVYWNAVLNEVNMMPGLDISLTTVPRFSCLLIIELILNLITSYPGTNPLLALPGCVLRALYMFKLLRFSSSARETRQFAIQSAILPDQRTTSALKAMLRKQPFALIGLALLVLAPLLGYMLLVTQRWTFREEEGSQLDTRRKSSVDASWRHGDAYQMTDSLFAVLFMIAIGEPYDVSDNVLDRMLALLTASTAAIFTTMLVTALIQLIEADAAKAAALEDSAHKVIGEELREAAGNFILVQWTVYRRAERMRKSEEKSQVLFDPEEQALFRRLLKAKQNFREILKRHTEVSSDEAANLHSKMQSVLNQNDDTMMWLQRYKGQLFKRLDAQNSDLQEMEARMSAKRDEMEGRLTRLLQGHAAEIKQMENQLNGVSDDGDADNQAEADEQADKLHQAQIKALREIEAREQKQVEDLQREELRFSMEIEEKKRAAAEQLHQAEIQNLREIEAREKKQAEDLHNEEMKIVMEIERRKKAQAEAERVPMNEIDTLLAAEAKDQEERSSLHKKEMASMPTMQGMPSLTKKKQPPMPTMQGMPPLTKKKMPPMPTMQSPPLSQGPPPPVRKPKKR